MFQLVYCDRDRAPTTAIPIRVLEKSEKKCSRGHPVEQPRQLPVHVCTAYMPLAIPHTQAVVTLRTVYKICAK